MNLKLRWHHMSTRKKANLLAGAALVIILVIMIVGPLVRAPVSSIGESLLDGSLDDVGNNILGLLSMGALVVFFIVVVAVISALGQLAYDPYGLPKQHWSEVARDLGLRFDTGGRGGKPILTGRWRDQYAEIALRYFHQHGHRQPPTPYTNVRLPLRRCPTEGLAVYPIAHGTSSFFGFKTIPGRFHLRNKSLDSTYSFHANHEGEAWNLLQQQPIQSRLQASCTDPWKIRITDGWIGLEAQGRRADSNELSNVLDHCLALRETFESAPAPATELPVETRLTEAWSQTGWLFGLPFDAGRRLLSGKVRKVGIQVWLETIDGVAWTRFRLTLAHPLEGEIEVEPRVAAEACPERIDRLRVVELGDRVFDRRFVVQASSAEAARARLNEKCRDLMIYCQDNARGLWLRPGELRLEYEGVMMQSDALAQAVRALLDLAEALGRRR